MNQESLVKDFSELGLHLEEDSRERFSHPPMKRGLSMYVDLGDGWLLSVQGGSCMHSTPREGGCTEFSAVEIAVLNPDYELVMVDDKLYSDSDTVADYVSREDLLDFVPRAPWKK